MYKQGFGTEYVGQFRDASLEVLYPRCWEVSVLEMPSVPNELIVIEQAWMLEIGAWLTRTIFAALTGCSGQPGKRKIINASICN
jgi:hypothetical protein